MTCRKHNLHSSGMDCYMTHILCWSKKIQLNFHFRGKTGCVCGFKLDIEDITRRCEDMNFIFEWLKQYFTDERSE